MADMNYTATEYIDGVMNETTIACKWVKLAVKRHLNDLENGHQRGLYFDEVAAKRVIKFFSFLRHSKGEWAGRRIELEPWQQFILWVVFGWKKADGSRRFKTVYQEVARKNGKSTLAAGIGLYLLDADREPGAEIYTVATKLKQAQIIHSEAKRMVRSSPHLKKRIDEFKDNLSVLKTNSKFEPLGRDSDTVDGLNPHGATIDELHAHKSGEMWDVLESALGARRQPLIYAITTAGFNQHGICYEQRDYVTKILEGVIEDDSYFGIIFTLDEDDDYFDETNWVKANPNLGVSVKLDDMRDMARKAKEMPGRLNNFLVKKLNIWTNAESRWVNWEKWKRCSGLVDEAKLIGRSCWAGLDLSSSIDITALVLVFPAIDGTERYDVLCRFWIPEGSDENTIIKRSRKDKVSYDKWAKQGFISITPGDVIDYNHILKELKSLATKFNIEEIAYDRWGASKLQTDLQDANLTVVEFGQGYASMSPAMRELERIYTAKLLNHGNNPVLNWMASNLVAKNDEAGNIKPVKPDRHKSKVRIDGMVSLLMGLDRAVKNKPKTSVYKTRGIRVLGAS